MTDVWAELDETDRKRWVRWLSDFRAKPGRSRPICSTCGNEWPCDYWTARLPEMETP